MLGVQDVEVKPIIFVRVIPISNSGVKNQDSLDYGAVVMKRLLLKKPVLPVVISGIVQIMVVMMAIVIKLKPVLN